MGSIISFFIKAINYVVFSIVRGVTSLIVMGAAMHVWTRVNKSRGRQIVRVTSLLYFPIVAVAVMAAFALADGIRLIISLSAYVVTGVVLALIIAVPSGLLLGFMSGARPRMRRTRWGRIIMDSPANYLVSWFASSVLAIFFLILPYGWLAIPTSALMLFATLQLLVAHLVLYSRFKALQAAAVRAVPGPAIDLTLDARAAAVISCGVELWAASPGVPISAQTFCDALRRGERLNGDYALAISEPVRDAWSALAGDRALLDETLRKLVDAGMIIGGYLPGPQLARLIRMGAMNRTVTIGHATFRADGGAIANQTHAVLAQTGGANLLFTEGAQMFSIREIKASAMVSLLAQIWLAPAADRG